MSEKDHYRFGLSKRGTRVNDNNALADDLRERIRELEAELAVRDAYIARLENMVPKESGVIGSEPPYIPTSGSGNNP
jgi:hypothetical protein